MTTNSYRTGPDENGHFGPYGGRYVAETLMPLILEVEKAFHAAREDEDFWAEFNALAKDFIGRPSPLYFAAKTTAALGGLTPGIVGGAIKRLHPTAVDVSSGVESTRGVKDPTKIHSFIQTVKSS